MVENFKKYFARFISPEAKSVAARFNNMLISASGEEKQKEVMDSIRYARRIQSALITSEKYIARNLNRLISNK